MKKEIANRSQGNCELCGEEAKQIYPVTPKSSDSADHCVHTCQTCYNQLSGIEDIIPNHWRCLNDSMWSEVDAVKVVAYRILNSLKAEGWPNDLLEMIYLDEETLTWAKTGLVDTDQPKHMDSNGVEIFGGDSVVLIKDLKVKGGNFTAKRGTAVRNVRLVHDNPEHIEGKVEGQTIVILTQYVKK